MDPLTPRREIYLFHCGINSRRSRRSLLIGGVFVMQKCSRWKVSASAGVAAAIAIGLPLVAVTPRPSVAEDSVEATAGAEDSKQGRGYGASEPGSPAGGGMGFIGSSGPREVVKPSPPWERPEGPTPAWLELGEEQSDKYSEGYLAFREKLREPIAVAYDGLPLREVMQDLSKRIGTPIVLDELGMAAGVSSPDDPVSIGPLEVPLDKAFELILEPLELGYAWDDGVLMISAAEEWNLNDVRCYDLTFVMPHDGPVHELIDLIETVVPGDWDTGEDSLTQFGSLLVVNAPEVTHQEIEGLLARIAAMPRQHFERAWTKDAMRGPSASAIGGTGGTPATEPANSGGLF